MRSLTTSALALLLMGCGGSDGGSPTPTPTPSATPTPAPSPTPSPSPSPSPTPSAYVPAYPGDANARADGIGVALTRTVSGGTRSFAVAAQPDTSRVGFDYTAATRTYSARYNGDTLTIATQRASSTRDGITTEIEAAETAAVTFARINLLGAGLDYVGGVTWDTPPADTSGSVVRRVFIFGSPTRAGDLPASGNVVYAGPTLAFLETTTGDDVPASISDIRIDWAAGTISGSITVGTVVLRVAGSVDRTTGTITGTLTDGSAWSGTISGDAYGPQAVNAGLVFGATLADGSRGLAGAALLSTRFGPQ